MKPMGEEIRRRFPRLTMSLIIAVIFWIVSYIVPETIKKTNPEGILIPGLSIHGFSVDAGFLIGTVTLIIAYVFLIRALSDALILGDILTDIFVKRLGIKTEISPKRAVRDFIYIILIILVAAAVSPFVAMIKNVGTLLSTVTTYIALGMILILIYDIGRILYRIIEQRAESVAERLAKMAEKPKENR